MADEWQYLRIEEVADKVGMGPFGSSIKVSTFVPDGIPVISGEHLRGSRLEDTEYNFITLEHAERLKSANVFRGDVIFTHAGNIGQVAYIPDNSRYERYVISQRQFYLRCNSGRVVPSFVTYFFKTAEGQHKLLANSSPSGVPSLAQPVTYLRTIEIPVPPVPIQQAIACILGALDDKIELNRRMNDTLEAMARAIFKSWFVDAIRDGLPEGWREVPISELCDINAWTLGKDDELDLIEYIEISEVSRGNIANTSVFERGAEPSRARRRLRHGDTVLSTVRPERGSYFLCLNPPPNLIASTGFAVLTPTKAPWSFLHTALTIPEVFEYLGQQADGGAYPAIRPEIIGKWQVPWTDDAKMVDRLHLVCAPLYERAENNRRESTTLAALRDSLLPKLISGELRVPDAERIVTRCA